MSDVEMLLIDSDEPTAEADLPGASATHSSSGPLICGPNSASCEFVRTRAASKPESCRSEALEMIANEQPRQSRVGESTPRRPGGDARRVSGPGFPARGDVCRLQAYAGILSQRATSACMHSAMGPRAPYRHSLKAHSVVRVHDGVSVQRETLGHRDTILTVVSAGQLERFNTPATAASSGATVFSTSPSAAHSDSGTDNGSTGTSGRRNRVSRSRGCAPNVSVR